MRTPSPKSKNILDPFSPLVWILIVSSSVLMIVIMYILISMLEYRILTTSGDDGDYFTTTQLSWFIWSALVKQGSILSPSGDASRVLFGTWWIFITIVTAFYTAQLTVVLSSLSWSLSVHNLHELHNDPTASWLALAGGATETILSTWPEYKFLQRDIRSGKGRFVASYDEAMEALDTGENEYFLTDTWTANMAVYDDYMEGGEDETGQPCKYTFTDEFTFAPQNIAFLFPKDKKYDDLKKKFNSVLDQLIQSGLLEKEFATIENKVDLVSLCKGTAHFDKKLKFLDVEETFYVVCGGAGLGLGIFILEHLLTWTIRLIRWILRLKQLEMSMKRRTRRKMKMKTMP